MKVIDILSKTKQGQDVIKFVREKKWIDTQSQKVMLTLLFEQLRADSGSPAK